MPLALPRILAILNFIFLNKLKDKEHNFTPFFFSYVAWNHTHFFFFFFKHNVETFFLIIKGLVKWIL